MKYSIKSFLSLLVTLGFLLSCAQTPQQIAEKTLALTKDSTVRLVSQAGKSITLGSGFFVDKNKIATNIHVVAQPGPVFAKLSNKETTLAVEGIVAFDVENNLVILKLAGKGRPLPIGDSDTVQSGESVGVVGYPNGRYKAMTGTIDSIFKSDKWFGIKGTISKESSGGPVLNSKGQVIGITVGYGDDSNNYAIPSNALKALLVKTMPLEPLAEWQKRPDIRAELRHSQGEQKSAAKDYKNAIVEFDKAIELNPEHVRAYYKRARAKYYINDYAGAIDDCTHAIKLNPEYARAYNGRGIAKIELGESKFDDGDVEKAQHLYQEAIEDITHAINIDPEDADFYSNRGGAKIKLGKSKSDDGDVEKAQHLYQEAIEDITHAINIDPEDADFYSNRGGAKIKLGKSKSDDGDVEKAQHLYQEAIEDITHAINIDPENDSAYNNRGIAKCKLGDTESENGDTEKARKLYYEGIIDFDKATQLKYPEDADTSTARIESKKGRASTVRVTSWIGVSSEIFDGSGFFVDTDKIATNIHVVARPGPVFIKVMDNETIWEVIGVTAFNVEYDLVVLKLSGEGLPLPLGDSDLVQSGEPVVAVGFPGERYKVAAGNVHGIRNSDKLLGTTAKISKGGSGGPLLNGKGEVIGINTRTDKYTFAVPSNILKALLTRSVSPEPLAQWQKRDHIRAHAYYDEGEKRFNAGDYTTAIKNFDNAILQNPKYIRAYNWRGRAKYRLGESKAEQGNVAEAQNLYHAAIEDYTQAIKINPEFAIVLNNRGQAKHYLGQSKADQGDVATAQHLFNAAINDYTLSIKIDSKYTVPYFHRGVTRLILGQSKANQKKIIEAQRLYAAAVKDFTNVIKINPEHINAYNNLGSTKHSLAKSKAEQGNVIEAEKLYQAAIDDYTKAISINPKYVSAYNNRGVVKKALGQPDEAEKDFAKAKELESKK